MTTTTEPSSFDVSSAIIAGGGVGVCSRDAIDRIGLVSVPSVPPVSPNAIFSDEWCAFALFFVTRRMTPNDVT